MSLRGGGAFNRLAFTPSGLPAVLQYNATGAHPGVYLDLSMTDGGLAARRRWTPGGQPLRCSSGLRRAAARVRDQRHGLFAAAYYDMGTSRLLYVESDRWRDVVPPRRPWTSNRSTRILSVLRVRLERRSRHRLLPVQRDDGLGLRPCERRPLLGSPQDRPLERGERSRRPRHHPDGLDPALGFVSSRLSSHFRSRRCPARPAGGSQRSSDDDCQRSIPWISAKVRR